MAEVWIGVAVTAVIQIVGIAYVTGRYSQMMADHGRRIADLEEDAKTRIFPQLGEIDRRLTRAEEHFVGRRGHE